MKVAIDTAPLQSGHKIRGMGVYVKNLITEIEKLKENNFYPESFVFSENKGKLREFELLHYPYFDLFFHTLSIKQPQKFVVTVPDVTPLLYPKNFPPGIKGSIKLHLQKQALKKASAVITISETSKKDIVRYLDVKAEKIFPIYLAPQKFTKRSAKTLQSVRKKYKLPKQFVLYVGDANYNKNLLTLIEACKKSKTPIVMVGKSLVSTDYNKNHIENKDLNAIHEKYAMDPNVIRLGYLENEEFDSIWQLATIFCMPSRYEGFGLPILEAFQAGVPVLSARTQALVEIAGEGAIYADTESVNDFASKIEALLKNKDKREALVRKGKDRVKNFSWEKTAQQTYEVYKKVLSN